VGDCLACRSIGSFLLTGKPDSHPPECVIPDDVLIKFGPPDDEHLLLVTCKVKQSRYRPGVAQRVPGIKVSRFHDKGTG
jgi:hypothetical protein